MFQENVSMSVSNVFHNRMRSFLTILGIIIGVAAVIAMITTVSSVTGEITSQFASMGTGKFNVTVSGTSLKPGLTPGDVETLSEVDNVDGITVSMSSTAVLRHGSAWTDEATMEGRNTFYFAKNPELLERGTLPSVLDEEQATRVCLISSDLQESLFYGEDPLGQTLMVNGHTFIVTGILSSSSTDVIAQAMGNRASQKVVVPYTTAMRMGGNSYIRSLEVYVKNTDETESTISSMESAIQSIFNGRENTYTIINMASMLSTMDTILGMMTTLLAGIAGISLLVGGIGIMNMMLVSVTERTTEIGLRKALGAEPGQIQLQFLIEAFILSMLGGFFGILTGLALSWLLSVIIGSPFTISWSAIALGAGFSAIVGLVFGWAPARKASRLNPIDALRAM
ncbi:MAG: ABC transporter permease [Clostridia bacterium]|nr:ABC transporter permease [Clostridia bacterium]